MKTIDLIKTVLLILVTTGTVYAQKQPQVQQVSVRAPDNLKIDGKLDEWASPNLNAFNPADRIFYVISNDDDNLYFAIRGLGNGVAKKVIAGGMVITINKIGAGKKDNVLLSFPLPQKSDMVMGIMGVINQIGSYDDQVTYRKQIDSIAAVGSQVVNKVVKEIGITGVKEIPDLVISKYNEYGIKAAIQFTKMQPVIELAIPLKYLGLQAGSAVSMKYNIKLNEIPVQSSTVAVPLTDNLNPNLGYAFNATDFSGEYTLAKKP